MIMVFYQFNLFKFLTLAAPAAAAPAAAAPARCIDMDLRVDEDSSRLSGLEIKSILKKGAGLKRRATRFVEFPYSTRFYYLRFCDLLYVNFLLEHITLSL